jgi:hypothetical protein
MALNPAFATSSTRKLPFACGYVLGAGDMVLSTVALDGSQYALFLLGEGEWDGFEMMSTFPVAATGTSAAVPPHLVWPKNNIANSQTYTSGIYFNTHTQATWYDYPGFQWGAPSLHFHSGAYTPIGTVIPALDPITGLPPANSSSSMGPDQGYDAWFSQFPTVTPPQAFSGIAYVIFCIPGEPSYARGTPGNQTINGTAVWRTTRCRIFDAYGNVVSYGFTCNPAWHKVEALLRFKIRPQQPGLAGLTDAEKACFDWPSIVALAERNDYILPNGKPRFTGNYIFASDASLTNIMETMMRVDRSYQRVEGNKIILTGDDPRASVFLASAKHLISGTLKLDKKDVTKSPNVFVPSYRDLDIPAVSTVQTVLQNGMWSFRDGEAFGMTTFVCSTPSPFANQSYLTYGGSVNPALDGDYPVWVVAGNPYPDGASYPNNTYSANVLPEGSPAFTLNNAGGYLGSNDARFSARVPTNVQHRSAQRMMPRQAPGLSVQPQIRKVVYDCGNSTFDQTNRLMKFERDRTLGTDTGAGWTAPICGTISFHYECVDANGKRLCDIRNHDVITLDDWLTPEFTGSYEVIDSVITAPEGTSLGQIDLTLMAYNINAATDVSDAPGNYYMSVPNSSMDLTGFTPVANAAWVMQATLAISSDISGDGKLTIAIPDLSMQLMGQVAPTAYPTFSVTGIPPSTPIALYVVDPGSGAAPTFGFVVATGVSQSSSSSSSTLFGLPISNSIQKWLSLISGALRESSGGVYYYPIPNDAMIVATGSFTAP